MRKEFWGTMVIGFILTIFVSLGVGMYYSINRISYVLQTRIQAAYLTELSGYEGKEQIPHQEDDSIKNLINVTMSLSTESQDPEVNLLGLLTFAKNEGKESVEDSCIAQLILNYPGSLNLALKGDTSSARQLQEKWYKTRNIGFYPFGMILMLIFLSGTLLTIIVASESVFKEYASMKEGRGNWYKKYNQVIEGIELLLKEKNIYPRDYRG